MKYIVITGKRDEGKSTTIDAVCKKLNPDKVFKLKERLFIEIPVHTILSNGTYLLEINGLYILVVAGSPTEQEIKIDTILEICVNHNYVIIVALVAKRTSERRLGYNTMEILAENGELMEEFFIEKVLAENYRLSREWNGRIDEITGLISNELTSVKQNAMLIE